MVARDLEVILSDEMGIIVASAADVIDRLEKELARKSLPEDVRALVREVVGAEKIDEVCPLIIGRLGDIVGGAPSDEWIAKIAGKYPGVAQRLEMGADFARAMRWSAELGESPTCSADARVCEPR